MSTIVLSAMYATSAPPAMTGGHADHDSYLPPVSPDSLGGTYEFRDLKNRAIDAADFKGQWTLLFFGYARCKGSCPVATPKIVKAAQLLRARGLKARAVFVDIDAPRTGFVRRDARQDSAAGHAHSDMGHLAAMRGLQSTYGSDLTVLTGSRLQLANAARAFLVAREHRPPRAGEVGHSINHSSRIYLIAPDTKVAGYGHHGSAPAELASMVARLNAAHGAATHRHRVTGG